MKSFHISATNASREFEGNDNDTVISILSHASVRSFFGFATGEDTDAVNQALSVLVPNITSITNGGNTVDMTQLPHTFREAVLQATLEDGAEIEINYYAAEDNDANEVTGGFDPAAEDNPDDDGQADNWRVNGYDTGMPLEKPNAEAGPEPVDPPQGTADTGRHGIVTVTTSGGLVRTTVDIEDGVTTLRTVLYNKQVLNRAGMDDTAMSNCMVVLNGDVINPNNIHIRKLHAGDTIDLTPRYASKLGSK